MNINFPFGFDSRGCTNQTGYDEHIRDMLEQLIFTNPGERVNRPDFGSGVLQLIFAPNSPELAATVQFTLQAAIQRYMGDIIDLHAVEVRAVDSSLSIDLGYSIRLTGQIKAASFSRNV